MKTSVSIGDFSRMTHLSIKTLRHYHEVGLLAPRAIDEKTGYRYYERSQVPLAQVIRRFRELDMPVEEVRAIVGASDPAARNALIVAHLDRLERRLSETRTRVAALRAFLEQPLTPIAVEHRSVVQTASLAISARISVKDASAWMGDAFTELYGALRALGVQASGPSGGLWATELFLEEEGEAVVFVPVQSPVRALGRGRPLSIPAAELAVTVHHGAHADVDRSYGALGTHVTAHELGVDGPVREYYLVDRFNTSDATLWCTEIAWPIFQTTEE